MINLFKPNKKKISVQVGKVKKQTLKGFEDNLFDENDLFIGEETKAFCQENDINTALIIDLMNRRNTKAHYSKYLGYVFISFSNTHGKFLSFSIMYNKEIGKFEVNEVYFCNEKKIKYEWCK